MSTPVLEACLKIVQEMFYYRQCDEASGSSYHILMCAKLIKLCLLVLVSFSFVSCSESHQNTKKEIALAFYKWLTQNHAYVYSWPCKHHKITQFEVERYLFQEDVLYIAKIKAECELESGEIRVSLTTGDLDEADIEDNGTLIPKKYSVLVGARVDE